MIFSQCAVIVALTIAGGRVAVFAENQPTRRHVLVVVWDGMRPDLVSEQNSPALWRLAQDGVTFQNHHSVYPSATNVNGTALVTGVYPGHSGILANHEYRPEIDDRRIVDVENAAVIGKADAVLGGKYVSAPTLPELIRAAGRRSIIATAKTVGRLQDRHLPGNEKNSFLLASGEMPGANVLAQIVTLFGAFPTLSFAAKDSWTTKTLTDVFWHDGVADFSLLWLSEPDGTQHESAPGSPDGIAAVKTADENLARVLAALDRQHSRQSTDIFVVSDHGFSTIARSIDVRKILAAAGFDVVTEFSAAPTAGQIVIDGNGGSLLFYVIGRDAAVTRRLVEFLQQTDFAGVIFTRDKLPGTFALDDAKIDNVHAADVVMAFRWNDSKSQFGLPGMIDADWQRQAGKGTHATLSRFDLHNLLIAAGPDFQRGTTDHAPTGNVDLAPTICAILGLKTPSMDGRVLGEAMTDAVAARPETTAQTIEATKSFATGTWRQSLRYSRVGSTVYLDEGNGGFEPAKQ